MYYKLTAKVANGARTAAGSMSNVDEADAAPDTTRQFQSTG